MIARPPQRTVFVGHVFDTASIHDLRAAISRAATSTPWTVIYADEAITTGHILIDKIIPQIQQAEFCLFEISDHTRPNVFIELGIAKGLGKPCVLLVKIGHDLPSDLGGYDRLHYSSYKDLTAQLRNTFTTPPSLSPTEMQVLSASPPSYGAFLRVYASDKGISLIHDLLKPANTIVFMLGLCGNPVEATAGAWDLIRSKANSGCQFLFLYMKPTSPLLKAHSEAEDGDASSERLSLQSTATVQSLRRLRSSIVDPSKIQLRHYDRIPTACVMQFDEKIYVGPYLFGARGIDGSWFEIAKIQHPVVFEEYRQTFYRLWADERSEVVF
jgi:hypothetical protein